MGINSAPGKTWSGGAHLSAGGFYNGKRHAISPKVNYRRDETFSAWAGWDHNTIDLGSEEGSFTVNLARAGSLLFVHAEDRPARADTVQRRRRRIRRKRPVFLATLRKRGPLCRLQRDRCPARTREARSRTGAEVQSHLRRAIDPSWLRTLEQELRPRPGPIYDGPIPHASARPVLAHRMLDAAAS